MFSSLSGQRGTEKERERERETETQREIDIERDRVRAREREKLIVLLGELTEIRSRFSLTPLIYEAGIIQECN